MLRIKTTSYLEKQADAIKEFNESLLAALGNTFKLEELLGNTRAQLSAARIELIRKKHEFDALNDRYQHQIWSIAERANTIIRLKDENEKLHLGFEYYKNLWEVSQELLRKEEEKREAARNAKFTGSSKSGVSSSAGTTVGKRKSATAKPRTTSTHRKTRVR